MEYPNKADIQGLLRYAYGRLKVAYYVFLEIKDLKATKNWLQESRFQTAELQPTGSCINIAFHANGLRKLGLEKLSEYGFQRAFVEGMDTDHRNRILGDFDLNTPENWRWGNRSDQRLHLMLMLFARNPEALEDVYLEQKTAFEQAGMEECHEKISGAFIQNKEKHFLEHFGFRDGLSQPLIQWDEKPPKGPEDQILTLGEFVLGYRNAYDQYPLSILDPQKEFDLGKNGSYMVFRQIAQDVPLFWQTLLKQCEAADTPAEAAIELAGKMVGRKPDGSPLVPPNTDTGKRLNDFRFHEDDPKGYFCPHGSHIRRSNPRDSKSKGSKQKNMDAALRIANKHRILRRGRPFGPPIVEGMALKDIIQAAQHAQHAESRGLNFICFNSDIERQFEFVQHTWANNRKFAGLYNDVDPIIGVQREGGKMAPTQFEVPAKPVRKRYKDLPAFVRVIGGSYFFFPSIQTIRFLSTL